MRIMPGSGPAVDAARGVAAPAAAGAERTGETAQRARDPAEVTRTVDKLNRTAEVLGSRLKFQVDMDTGEVSVKVIDRQSGRVIRQIPPERALDALAQMQEALGLLFDERA